MTEQNELNLKIKAETFYPFIKGANELLPEAQLVLINEGARIWQTDNGGIAMIHITVPNRFFSKYQIGEGKKIGLNLDNLITFLPKKNADIEILYSTDTIIQLKTNIEGVTENVGVPIIEITDPINKIPNINATVTLGFDAPTLKAILKKAGQVSSFISISATQTEVTFSAKGENGTYEQKIPRDIFGNKKYSVVGSNPIRSSFNLDYLNKIVKTAEKTTIIDIAYAQDEVIKIEYVVAGVELKYWLANYMES